MSRIQAAFAGPEQRRLITYSTAGDPDGSTSAQILIALARAGAAVLAGVVSPGSIFTSAGLCELPDIVQLVTEIVHHVMRVPENAERDEKQNADQHISPERSKPQPQSMHDDVLANDGNVSIAAGEPHIPSPQGLQRDNRRINGNDPAEEVSPEIEEVDVWHTQAVSGQPSAFS